MARSLAAWPSAVRTDVGTHRVLVVINDASARETVLGELAAAALQVTAVPVFDLADALSAPDRRFDLLVTAQSPGEMAQFGLPQLARSLAPSLPILLLDSDVARGPGTALAALQAIARWPLPQHPAPQLH